MVCGRPSAAPILDSQELDESGGHVTAGALDLVSSEGQTAIGSGHAGSLNLDSGFVNSISLDVRPPRTSILVGVPSSSSGGHVFVSSHTRIALSAVDDLLAIGDGAGVGVRHSYVAIDSQPASLYLGPFSIQAEGPHTISYFSVDTVGNTETPQSYLVDVDTTPPATQLTQSSSLGQGYVSSQTVFTLSAVDPVSDGRASGVAATLYSIDGRAFSVSPSSFTLSGPDGPYTIEYYSQDNVGNSEGLQSTTVKLDQTPPVTAVSVGASSFTAADGALYVSQTAPIVFTAVDPSSGSVASGVGRTEFSIDATTFSVYVSTFVLPPGAHTITYRSVDMAGNIEATRSLALRVDGAPPATSVLPSGAFFVAAGQTYAPASFRYSLAAQDPIVSGVASGVASTRYSLDSGPFIAYASTFSLTEGARLVSFQSQDNVGNLELLRSATIFVDATPPVTSLMIGSAPAVSGTFIGAGAALSLSAIDPVNNGVASGVGATRFSVDGGTFAVYGGTLTLAVDGPHALSYYSTDDVGNAEAVKVTTITLDTTPPVTIAHVGSPQYTAGDGSVYVTPATPVSFTAADAGSGVSRTEVALDGGSFSPYAAALRLPEGGHTILYRSIDAAGNIEAAKSLSLKSDATPPLTALSESRPFFSAGGVVYEAGGAAYGLSSTDPAGNGVASGVAFTRYSVDRLSNISSQAPTVSTGPFQAFASTFSLVEGAARINFFSQDNVGNAETAKTQTIYVDATAPVTALAVGLPQYSAGGVLFVGPATPIALAAQDPVAQEVASGVGATSVRLDTGAYAAYASSFTLSGQDGSRVISWFSTDNVGNAEAARSATLALDATPPQTTLSFQGGRQAPGLNGTVYVSSDTLIVLTSTDPLVGGAASGLAEVSWRDGGGQATAYAGPFALAGGAHSLTYQAQDNVGNVEAAHAVTVLVDSAPPASTVAFGTPFYAASDGTVYVATGTPIRVSAADPALPTGQPGSGVARIELSIDGSAFAASSGAMTLAEGAHTLAYRAIDAVGNVEATHSLVVRADATTPQTSVSVGQPSVSVVGGVLISSRTPLSFTALDPLGAGVASGVNRTLYAIDGDSFAVSAGSFTLSGSDGAHILAFYSIDQVGNAEAVKTFAYQLDTTPPAAALLSPNSTQAGIARVFKGKFAVLGSVSDAHFQSYTLEYAPGQGASNGFVSIGSGTVAVSSGTLGAWDASKLTGWQTLRLTAVDLSGNTAQVKIDVFIGDPGQLLLLGGDDVFNMPQGVAVGPDGSIYVADTNGSRIAVFSSTGTPLASYGQPGSDGGDNRVSSTTLVLNHPRSVFVDAASRIFVADTNDDRIVVLSPTGQLLQTIGRSGHAAGTFYKPSGVAADASGQIYVADTLNNRVQVLNASGTVVEAFSLPPAADLPAGEHDREAAQAADKKLGRPYGIAVDVAGHIYVADERGGRALEYSSSGQLLLTIPIGGRPGGIAVTPDGGVILVSDRKSNQVLKYDLLGNQTLAFGQRGKPADVSKITLHKPVGLALDSAGDLFIADRDDDRIKEVSLPSGQAPLVTPPDRHDDHVAREVLDRDEGGHVQRGDNAGIDVPPGALSDDLKIVVATAMPASSQEENAKTKDMSDKGMVPAYAPVQYYPEGTQFAKPVTLTLPYDPAMVAQLGINEDSLHVNYWDPVKQQWQTFDSTVDKNSHTVSAKTTHFSLYQVMSGSATTQGLGVQATASNTVDTVQIACNPLRPDCRPLKFQNLPAGARLRIYTLTGALVRDLNSDGSGQATWDGTNQSGANVASGVYFVLAQGNGTKKTFKVAVEK